MDMHKRSVDGYARWIRLVLSVPTQPECVELMVEGLVFDLLVAGTSTVLPV